MSDFPQDTRPLRVTLGDVDPAKYLITGFTGREEISRLPTYTLTLVAGIGEPLKFEDVLGKPALVQIDQEAGQTRFVHGIIRRLRQLARDNEFAHYAAEMVPPLWLLTKNIRSRIFQQKDVKTIIEEVIGSLYTPNFDHLEGTYHPRNICAQYRESDFAFISRLMEEEGIYFYFTHTEDEHGLVIADNPRGHLDTPIDITLKFQDASLGEIPPEGRITRWDKAQELRTGAVDLSDHWFEMPTNDLRFLAFPQDTSKAGTVLHQLGLGGMDKTGLVEHPGGYAHWRDGIAPGGAERPADLDLVFEDNSRITGVRMNQIETLAVRIEGGGTYNRMTAGHKFTLADHFDADGDYATIAVTHNAVCGTNESGGAADFRYTNTFECLPIDLPFLPQRETPRPTVKGTQTAVVVGDDPEIDPDKYGRVKVWFRWDPEAPRGLESSCWVRVAQFWAGRQWGAQFIPRVGDEVIVAFLEGDPDQPIIIGSVYNANNTPIYTLPANKTQSGIKTHTPEGDSEKFNELRFEDKKGHEQIVIHAEKDMSTSVENNNSLSVGNNHSAVVGSNSLSAGSSNVSVGGSGDPKKHGTSTTTIFGDTKFSVTKGDYNFDVQTGTATYHVTGDVTENYDAKQTTTVKGDQLTHVTKGHHLVQVDTGSASLHVKAGNRFVNVGSGFYDLIAATKITLTVGSSSLEMLADGTITLKGVNILVDGSTSVKVIGGGAKTDWEDSKIDATGSAGVKITGATIKLNS